MSRRVNSTPKRTYRSRATTLHAKHSALSKHRATDRALRRSEGKRVGISPGAAVAIGAVGVGVGAGLGTRKAVRVVRARRAGGGGGGQHRDSHGRFA